MTTQHTVSAVIIPAHDILARQAQADPAAYEAWRREIIEDFISRAPARLQERLRGLQWRIDCVRRQSKSALGSTIRIYELMWESFVSLNNNWQELSRQNAGQGKATAEGGAGAQIIEFQAPVGQRPHGAPPLAPGN